MKSELPKSWLTVPLGEITEINPRHAKELDDSMLVSFATMAALNEDKPTFQFLEERPFGAVRKGFTHFAEGDVLFAKITPCMENGKGAVAIGLRNGLGCGTTELHVFRPHAGINPHYIYRFLAQPLIRREAKENFTGTAGQARVPTAFVEELEIPLPPLGEQRRIMVKLEKLLTRMDVCQQRFAKIKITLKRFRQSVLDAAITGKLTLDWRSRHPVVDNAKNELESLLAITESQRPRKKQTEQEGEQQMLIEAMPKEWVTPTLGDLFRFIDYRGKTPKRSESGKRLISAKNIKMGYISEEPVEYVSEKIYQSWMTRGFPKKDDIFFVTEGHTMGFVALNNRNDEFALAQRTITLQPWQPIEMRCFFFFLMSSLFQNFIRLNATGSAAVGIKASRFRCLPIPFPSQAEQKEIVSRVESMFALADKIETRYMKAKVQVDKLPQSILTKTFRGQLVPQDPDDESAEKLLERILKMKKQEEFSNPQKTRSAKTISAGKN